MRSGVFDVLCRPPAGALRSAPLSSHSRPSLCLAGSCLYVCFPVAPPSAGQMQHTHTALLSASLTVAGGSSESHCGIQTAGGASDQCNRPASMKRRSFDLRCVSLRTLISQRLPILTRIVSSLPRRCAPSFLWSSGPAASHWSLSSSAYRSSLVQTDRPHLTSSGALMSDSNPTAAEGSVASRTRRQTRIRPRD